MFQVIAQRSTSDNERRVIVYKDRAKGSATPFLVEAITSNRPDSKIFNDLFEAVKFANEFLRG